MTGYFTDAVNTRQTHAGLLSQGHLADGREVMSC